MNSSNSFNICPRCGNSNALSAKYCSRCGGQLKIPEEPVVCHKCHTRNSPMANFCRNCGAVLKVGLETKICPKCGKEVDAHATVCVCGYSFVTFQQTQPLKTPVRETAHTVAQKPSKTVAKANTKKSSAVVSKKGGRGFAIGAMILLLLFAYLAFAPVSAGSVVWRPAFLTKLDNGFVSNNGYAWYGGNYLYLLIQLFTAKRGGGTAPAVGSANWILAGLTVVSLVAMIAHLAVCIARCVTSKKSKRVNWLIFTMAVLYTVIVGLIVLFNSVQFKFAVVNKIASLFKLPEGFKVGYAIWILPLYYWIFFVYSIFAKGKVLKEKK